MRKSIGLNAVINGLKTILSLIFPLITYPYIARILQVEAIGQYNFSQSFISYFYLLAALGVPTYAIREGSRLRDDVKRLSAFASEVFTINIISTVISYCLLIISVIIFDKLRPYSLIIAVLSVTMLFTTMGCEWILTLYEEYLYIAIRTIVFLVVSLVLMFLLVKDKEDVVIYAGILVLSNSGANIINYFSARSKCRIKITTKPQFKCHLKPILILFANSIATTVYVNSDIIILGLLTSDYHTGIYTLSSKIYSIIKQVLSAIVIVSIPRFSWLLGNKDIEGYHNLASRLINTLITFVFPCAVGLFSLSKEVILTISTDEFLPAIIPLRLLCVALLFCMFTWFYTSCVLIPHKKEKIVLVSTMIAASANVILNIILIPVLHESAAAITTVIAEATSFLICFFLSKRLVKIQTTIKDIISIIVGCIGIYFICHITRTNITYSLGTVAISVFGSVIVYTIILCLFKNSSIVYMISVFQDKLNKGKSLNIK